MTPTHTVIELSPGEIVDTGARGDKAFCESLVHFYQGLEADRSVFYAVISIERDLGALREQCGLAVAA